MELTTPQLAEHLGISVETIYSWICRRGLKAPPRKRLGKDGGPPRIWTDADIARIQEFRQTVPRPGARPGNHNRKGKCAA
jgi:predicted DNA-binding transcriptional regulator AlpA